MDGNLSYLIPERVNQKSNQYDSLIEDSARRNNVNPDLIRAMMKQESNFNPKARSHKNAQGLMQLIPATAKRFGVKNIYDPAENIEAGTKYMRFLLDRFDGDVKLALAGYNAGEGAVDKYKRTIPPYRETRDYVKKIYGNYNNPNGYYSKLAEDLDYLMPSLELPETESDLDYLNPMPEQPTAQLPEDVERNKILEAKNLELGDNPDPEYLKTLEVNQQAQQPVNVQQPVGQTAEQPINLEQPPTPDQVSEPRNYGIEGMNGYSSTERAFNQPDNLNFNVDKNYRQWLSLTNSQDSDENRQTFSKLLNDTAEHSNEDYQQRYGGPVERYEKDVDEYNRSVGDYNRNLQSQRFGQQANVSQRQSQRRPQGKSQPIEEFKTTVSLKGKPDNMSNLEYVDYQVATQLANKLKVPVHIVEAELKAHSATTGNEATTSENLGRYADGKVPYIVAKNVIAGIYRRLKNTETVEDSLNFYKEQGLSDKMANLFTRKDFGLVSQEEYDKEYNSEMQAREQLKKQKSDVRFDIEFAQRVGTRGTATVDTDLAREKADKYAQDDIDRLVTKYGSIDEFNKHQKEIEEKYKFRPLARPLEFARNFYGVIPQAISSVLKASDILADITPINPQKIYAYLSGNKFKAEKGTAYKLGQALESLYDQALPSNKDFQEEFHLTTLPNIFGQTLVQAALAVGTGGATAPVLLGSAMGATEQYEEAPEGYKKGAAVIGGLAAISDALPLMRMLKPLNKTQRGTALNNLLGSFFQRAKKEVGEKQAVEMTKGLLSRITKNGGTIVKSALGEGLQELSEKKINDLSAKLTYDPKRQILYLDNKDLMTFFGGALGGSVFGGIRIKLEQANPQIAEQVEQEINIDDIAPKALPPQPDYVDAEVLTDEEYESDKRKEAIRKQESTFTPKPKDLEQGVEPLSLESQNPIRKSQVKDNARAKLALDSRVQKLADILSSSDSLTKDEIQRKSRYNQTNLDETINKMFDAGMVEVLANDSIRLIKDLPKPKSFYNEVKEQNKPKKEKIKLSNSPIEEKLTLEQINQQTAQQSKNDDVSSETAKVTSIKSNKPVKEVVTEAGTSANVTPQVVDEKDLITSLDSRYPQAYQPRDRSRKSSKAQIAEIANNLNPTLLDDSPKASDGRPLVVPVDVNGQTKYAVISGNGRTEAIKQAYELDNQASRNYSRFVSGKGEVSSSRPVYVGVLNPLEVQDLAKFAKEANESNVAQMSATEQSTSDADNLNANLLNLFVPSEDGSFNLSANEKFSKAFLNTIPKNERGNLVDSEGALNQAGITRVKNAIFAKAFSDSNVLQRMTESTDSNIKNVTNALTQVAPRFAKLKQAIADGVRYNLDITNDIAKASEKFSSLREKGTDVPTYLRQQSLIGEELSTLQKDILSVIGNAKSAKQITDVFNNYLNLVEEAGNPNQASMFEGEKPTKRGLLTQATTPNFANLKKNKKQTKNLSPSEKASLRRKKDVTDKELKDAGVNPLGEKGKYGQTSYAIKRNFLSKDNVGDLNNLSKVVLNENPNFDADTDYKSKQSQLDAVLDNIAKSQNKDRSSQLSLKDWNNYLNQNAHKLPKESVIAFEDALSHQQDFNKRVTEFTNNKDLESILDDIDLSTLESWKNLPRKAKIAINKIGKEYGLSRQVIKETFNQTLSEIVAEKPTSPDTRKKGKTKDKESQTKRTAGSQRRNVEFAKSVNLAPNGKPSNLNPHLYKLVRTKAFKDWFGDWENKPKEASKVVDENGEPLVVYHGTVEDFEVFKGSSSAYYFSPNPTYASNIQSGQSKQKTLVKPIFLNIRKLVKPRFKIRHVTVDNYLNSYKYLVELPDGLKGIDDGTTETSYVVFKQNQIKSIFNEGTFSKSDDSILKAVTQDPSKLQSLEPEQLYEVARNSEYKVEKEGVKISPAHAEILYRVNLIVEVELGSLTLEDTAPARFRGVHISPSKVKAIANKIKDIAKKNNDTFLEQFAEDLKTKATKDGSLVAYKDTITQKHEGFHQATYLASNKVSLAELVDITEGENQSAFKKAKKTLLRVGYADKSPLLIEEMMAHINEGKHPKLGLTRLQAKRFAKWWYNSFADKGHNLNHPKFDQAAHFTKGVLADVRKQRERNERVVRRRNRATRIKRTRNRPSYDGLQGRRVSRFPTNANNLQKRREATKTTENKGHKDLTLREQRFLNRKFKGNQALVKRAKDEILFAKALQNDWSVGKTVIDATASVKSIQASVDFSAGRQALVLVPNSPVLFGRAFIKQFKALNRKNFEKYKRDLDLHPYIELAEESGLYLATLADQSDLNQREEQFMSRLFSEEKLFSNKALELVRKWNPLSFLVRKSEDAFVTLLDDFRINVFEKFARSLNEYNVRKGIENDIEQYKQLANFINTATGRGDLKFLGADLSKAGGLLNATFFSARYWHSRLRLLNPFFYAGLPKGTRKIAIQNMAGFVGAFSLLMLLLKLAGADVEWDDPDNPNALKAKFGNYTYDFGGGLIQNIRYVSRVLKSTYTGKGSPKYYTERLIRSKLSPVPGAIWNLAEGNNYIGEPTSLFWELFSLVKPITVDNFQDAAKADGTAGIVKTIPEVFGIGGTRYKKIEEYQEEINEIQKGIKILKSPAERAEARRWIKTYKNLIRRTKKYATLDKKRKAERASK